MLPVKVGFELEYEADDDDGEEGAERFKGFENSSGQRWSDSSKTAQAQAERSVERSSTLPSPPAKRGRAILLSVTGDISLLAVSAERRKEGDEGGKIGAATGVTSVTACRALLDVTYHPPAPSKIILLSCHSLEVLRKHARSQQGRQVAPNANRPMEPSFSNPLPSSSPYFLRSLSSTFLTPSYPNQSKSALPFRPLLSTADQPTSSSLCFAFKDNNDLVSPLSSHHGRPVQATRASSPSADIHDQIRTL
ncbi:uncharacterized protein UDID_17796 [Ustilago sp. UG-2017a]|nr:uncharacterized protein UDID_17796 [Ustilago sp. UG-2017a]